MENKNIKLIQEGKGDKRVLHLSLEGFNEMWHIQSLRPINSTWINSPAIELCFQGSNGTTFTILGKLKDEMVVTERHREITLTEDAIIIKNHIPGLSS